MTICAKKWSKLSEADRKIYFKKAVSDRARYENEMKQFNTQGFFINAKGENSMDIFKDRKLGKNVIKPKKVITPYVSFAKA